MCVYIYIMYIYREGKRGVYMNRNIHRYDTHTSTFMHRERERERERHHVYELMSVSFLHNICIYTNTYTYTHEYGCILRERGGRGLCTCMFAYLYHMYYLHAYPEAQGQHDQDVKNPSLCTTCPPSAVSRSCCCLGFGVRSKTAYMRIHLMYIYI